ncbi:hypothetical protein SAMN05446037_1008148 [Anaerovirgula multivorans]|uniref:Uncharacterized protein n=1 Tax=Anaerovirgula multivorans TaxID=312168 RepID=A0A239DVN5_9FIRM|nr:hypothetical protein SAMN05446037_1008148 [Anaerovirgula multivorans]
MLEFTKGYSIKEIGNLKDFITVTYILIDNIYQKVAPIHIKKRRNFKDFILIAGDFPYTIIKERASSLFLFYVLL